MPKKNLIFYSAQCRASWTAPGFTQTSPSREDREAACRVSNAHVAAECSLSHRKWQLVGLGGPGQSPSPVPPPPGPRLVGAFS